MSDSPEHVQPDSLPRVAVIAVHGVNTNQPFETARSIAKMLLRGSSDLSEYPEFKETAEHIFVERVKIGVADTGGHEEDHICYWFDERAPSIRRAQQRRDRNVTSEAPASDIPLDHQYMTDQLRQYTVKGNDAFYDTIRIEGIRSNVQSEHRCRVHVFELFWADLSRRAFGVFQGFIELYEILFFLCSLGRKTLDFARATHPKSFWWWSFGSAQVMAERILVLAIPIVNLCMLAIGSILLPALFAGPRVLLSALIVLYAAAISALGIFAALRRWLDGDGARWPIIFVPVSLTAIVAGYLSQGITDPKHEYRTLATLWALTALLGVIVVCRLYDRMRRGAMLSGVIATGLTMMLSTKELWFGSATIDKTDQFYVLDRVVRTDEWLLTALNVAWIALLFFLFLMAVSDWLATRYACRCKFPERCQRAAWTAQITILLPASLVVILTSAFWKILIEFLTRLPGKDTLFAAYTIPIKVPEPLANFLPHGISQLQNKAVVKIQDAIRTMINAQGDDLVFLCIVLGVATALAIWALLPVIIAEIQPSKRQPTQAKSDWMGSALNAGYRTLRLSGEIVRWILLVSFASCAITLWVSGRGSQLALVSLPMPYISKHLTVAPR
jgi:hypothetical protein